MGTQPPFFSWLSKALALLFVIFLTISACSAQKAAIPFEENGKFGLRTIDGTIVQEPVYDWIGRTYHGYRSVYVDKKVGLVNPTGEIVIDVKYDRMWEVDKDGIAAAMMDGKWGYIDMNDKVLVPFVYDEVRSFQNGLGKVKRNNLYGFVDTSGREVIPPMYENLGWYWSEGLISAQLNKKWGFIDRSNRVIIPFEYADADWFSEGLAAVALNRDTWGYIDKDNQTIIPFIYKANWSRFRDGIACVQYLGKTGYIDREGKEVFPFKYYSVGRFCNGYADVKVSGGKDSRYGWVDSISHVGYVDFEGNEFLYPYDKNYQKSHWNVSSQPDELPDSTHLLTISQYNGGDFTYTLGLWDLKDFLSNALTGFYAEPLSYPSLCMLDEICISYGLMIGGGNYCDWRKDNGWEAFKKYTLFKILQSESLRRITWDWISPYYKEVFQTMNPFVQKSYKNAASYLKEYIKQYDQKSVEAYLNRDEEHFSHYDINGNYDPHRKLAAFVDRLIIIHKVITVKEAQRWINIIADEVLSW